MQLGAGLSVLSTMNSLNSMYNQIGSLTTQMSTGNAINNPQNNPGAYVEIQSMNIQVSGLSQAQTNVKQGNSLIQTATGAYQQQLSVLKSMYKLASQAAGGTETQSQLAQLQSTMNGYASQLTQTANTTNYNGLTLLNGKYDTIVNQGSNNNTMKIQVGAQAGQTYSFNFNAVDAQTLGVAHGSISSISTGNSSAGLTASTAANYGSIDLSGSSYSVSITTVGSSSSYAYVAQLQYTNTAGTVSNVGASVTVGATNASGTTSSQTVTLGTTGQQVNLAATSTYLGGLTASTSATLTVNTTQSTQAQFKNGVKLANATSQGGVSIMTQTDAQSAMSAIQSAINTMNGNLGQMGAYQDQLKFTSSNLSSENTNLKNSVTAIQGANMTQLSQKLQLDNALFKQGATALGQAEQLPSLIVQLLG